MTKICTGCQAEKPISEFAKKGAGYRPVCRVCHNAYYRDVWQKTESYQRHKEKVRDYKRVNRVKLLCQKYNITEQEYNVMLDRSGGMCESCGLREAKVVDHCHSTLIVRGLICKQCNTGIGNLGDNIEGVRKALDYLSKAANADSTLVGARLL